MMKLDDYQKTASSYMIPQCNCREYLGLGLAGEAGEVCDKLKKIKRGDGKIDDGLLDELGDVLWYVSQLSAFFGVKLSYIAQRNIDKLTSRQKRGVISGSGDKR